MLRRAKTNNFAECETDVHVLKVEASGTFLFGSNPFRASFYGNEVKALRSERRSLPEIESGLTSMLMLSMCNVCFSHGIGKCNTSVRYTDVAIFNRIRDVKGVCSY